MKPAFWARRAHKWIGLIIGVQALLWMISGVYMTVVPLDVIHGDHLAHVHGEPLPPQAARIDADTLVARYPQLQSFRLKHVLERDEVRAVLRDEHLLGGPALVLSIGLQARLEARHLEEVEADPVVAGHGEDRAPVAFLWLEPGLAQALPFRGGRLVEHDGDGGAVERDHEADGLVFRLCL